jgi:hypothetical protein
VGQGKQIMWVLVLTVIAVSGSAGRESSAPAVTTQEFTSQASCIAASDQATKAIEAGSLEAGAKLTVRGVCANK